MDKRRPNSSDREIMVNPLAAAGPHHRQNRYSNATATV
jgi:hypothetical protein